MNTERHPYTRRLALGLVAALLLLLPASARQQDKAPAGRSDTAPTLNEVEVIRRVNAKTDRALDYLEKIQIKEGADAGAWVPSNNAINAMAVLAFLSRGHVPGRGKYGDTVEGGVTKPGVLTRARKFILSQQSKVKATEGYFGPQMYHHGMCTLALAEMYGMDPDPELEAGLRLAVDCILRSQGPRGGWNYSPTPADGDLSVSVMAIVAMRAASNAEIPVPEAAIKKAIGYVKGMNGPGGVGFGYSGPGSGTPQTSAAGTLSLQLLGAYDEPSIPKTLDWLALGVKPTWKAGGASYFYYFHYYAMQAFYQHGGKQWNEWHGPVREMLLANQNADGSWDVPDGAEASLISKDNKAYSTALATLVLNIYQHYLPAYQR